MYSYKYVRMRDVDLCIKKDQACQFPIQIGIEDFSVHSIQFLFCPWYTIPFLFKVYNPFSVHGIQFLFCSWYTIHFLFMVYNPFSVHGIQSIFCSWYTIPFLFMAYNPFSVHGIQSLFCILRLLHSLTSDNKYFSKSS